MAQDNTQSTYSMSLGLAALLQSRESAGSDKHAVSRVSAPKFNSASAPDSKTSPPSTQATSPLNLTDLNQRVLSRSVALSSPRTLPGSRSFEQIMKEREHSPQFSLDEADRKEPSLFPPGMTGQGFLQQLKNKGYSLYGLWGGKPKEETASSADSSTDAVGGATAAPAEDPKASAKAVFANGSGVGVLGALTSFRRSGIL